MLNFRIQTKNKPHAYEIRRARIKGLKNEKKITVLHPLNIKNGKRLLVYS